MTADSARRLDPPEMAGPVAIEQKYTLPAILAEPALAFIAGQCRPHPRYPRGAISSIYFDTLDLRLLREKLNSDDVKTKVRLRWYEEDDDGTAFMEFKGKVGRRRFKTRIPLDWTSERCQGTPLNSVDYLALPALLAEHVPTIPSGLVPLLQVSFERRRYEDPLSGAAVVLDTKIRAQRAHPGRFAMPDRRPLAHVVIEIKSPRDEPPRFLDPLRRLGARRTAFSKYLHCYHRAAGQRPV